jgi:hypothetical protein
MDFAGGAVVDAGALIRGTRPCRSPTRVADHDAFHHLRTRADEAVVLDDGRVRLQRFEHAADAGAAGEMATFAPTCAQEPTVAQVSTMVPAPTCAPMLTKLGISTTSFAMWAPRRTIAPGTTRAPALRNAASS